jgi:transposase
VDGEESQTIRPHLPRIDIVVDIDDKTCPCCEGELHRIGEDKSERLDIVPAQFRVLVTRRPKYACRTCEDGVVQAPAPARLIEGGLPTEATVAQVLVSKYADHLPLYRPRVAFGGLWRPAAGGRLRRLQWIPPARAPCAVRWMEDIGV